MVDDLTLLNSHIMNLATTETRPELDSLEGLDSQAVTAIYNRYFPEIYRYVKYRLGNETDAEDISSEVFFRLLKAVKGGCGPGRNLRGWLIGAARHLVVDHIRWKYHHPHQALTDDLVEHQPEPGEQVEQRHASHSLKKAIQRLTEDQQQVLALRFGLGFSLEETARVLKKNLNAVKALQFRALNSLQRRIGDES